MPRQRLWRARLKRNTKYNYGQFVRSHEIDLHRWPPAGKTRFTNHGAKSPSSPPE